MKIAIVIGDDFVGDDPARLGTALTVLGHDVTVYVRQRDRRTEQKRPDRGYRIVSVRVGPGAVPSAADVLPFVGDWAATLEQQWSCDRPDIVHAFGWLGGLAAQLAARRSGRLTVQTFQGFAASSTTPEASSGENAARERLEPLLARNAGWATVESTSELETLARLRHGRERVSVLTGGIDVQRYTPVGPAFDRTDVYRILCLASNPLASNGFDVTIRALPRVPAAEIVVAETEATNRRNDEARAKLKRLTTELGVADRVRFLGAVPGSELPMLLRSIDVLACTPRQPPRATAALQAMASGVAVVGVPVGVLNDVVVTDVTGHLLSDGNPKELATALRTLAAERFRCEGMGAAGRNRAMSRYTWDRIALDSLGIYGRLSAGRLPSGRQAKAMEEVTR
ncbi:glycosyltransferase [Mycobacterium sp. pR1184]|uniref:glycosyltransferase n=1 Tax=Mycobacterium sp. pR1184 TaxID=3238981 RepID=UPI00351B95DD